VSADGAGLRHETHYQDITSDGHIRTHGLFYINGAYASFDCPLTTYSTSAYGINAADHIVGNYAGSGPGNVTRGFLYINGLYAVIEYPSATAAGTLPMGINDNDQISGTYSTSSGVGMVLTIGRFLGGLQMRDPKNAQWDMNVIGLGPRIYP
jgi:hypothetical protein